MASAKPVATEPLKVYAKRHPDGVVEFSGYRGAQLDESHACSVTIDLARIIRITMRRERASRGTELKVVTRYSPRGAQRPTEEYTHFIYGPCEHITKVFRQLSRWMAEAVAREDCAPPS